MIYSFEYWVWRGVEEYDCTAAAVEARESLETVYWGLEFPLSIDDWGHWCGNQSARCALFLTVIAEICMFVLIFSVFHCIRFSFLGFFAFLVAKGQQHLTTSSIVTTSNTCFDRPNADHSSFLHSLLLLVLAALPLFHSSTLPFGYNFSNKT